MHIFTEMNCPTILCPTRRGWGIYQALHAPFPQNELALLYIAGLALLTAACSCTPCMSVMAKKVIGMSPRVISGCV